MTMAVRLQCLTCGERVHGDADQIGARCPRCRLPLYEDPRLAWGSPTGLPDGTRCVVHGDNGAVGTCQRCGNFLCTVCRTRWRHQVVCIACVERALETQEATPAEASGHFRQAILAVLFGVIAWLITLAAAGLFAAGAMGKEPDPGLIGLGFMLLLVTPFPALLGVGQGAAAVRARGDHLVLATVGLLLSGMHTGALIGLFSMALWQKG
jgi:hypothetical protein